ncbi:MAG: hypothetical protein U0Z44_16225 [Kouleothrix sp.]
MSMRRLVPALSRRVPAGLLLALLAGLALRLALWGRLPRLGLISDEGEYLAAADWLAHGRGFDWYQGYFWTRAPLYPLFVAAHLRLFADAVAPIYVTQAALSLLNVALVYVLARHVGGHVGGYVDPHPGGYVDPHPGGYVDPHVGGYTDPPLPARHPGDTSIRMWADTSIRRSRADTSIRMWADTSIRIRADTSIRIRADTDLASGRIPIRPYRRRC